MAFIARVFNASGIYGKWERANVKFPVYEPNEHFTQLECTVDWQTAVNVRDYKSFSASDMLYYSVPLHTHRTTWQFSAYKSPNSDRCENRTVHIYLQQGSFPVINPLGETFPPNFNILRSALEDITITADSSVKPHTLISPLPGDWYAVAYLGDYIDDSITQEGLGTDCKYYVSVVHFSETEHTIDDLPIDSDFPVIASDAHSIFRFATTENTWQLNLIVFNCSAANESHSNYNATECGLRTSIRSLALPTWDNQSHVMDCTGSTSCHIVIDSPATNTWTYLSVQSTVNTSVTAVVKVTLKDCFGNVVDNEPISSNILEQNITANNTELNNDVYFEYNITHALLNEQINEETEIAEIRELSFHSYDPSTRHTPFISNTCGLTSNAYTTSNCVRIPELGRYTLTTKMFEVDFLLRASEFPLQQRLIVPDNIPLIVKFSLQNYIDIGATLKFKLKLLSDYLNDSSQIVTVGGCILQKGMPITQLGVACHCDSYIELSSEGPISDKIYFPYPEPGSWYISLIARCIAANGTQEPCRQEAVSAYLSVGLRPCVDGECGPYGTCLVYYKRAHRYSSCKCDANYRGYGCTDDSVADSDAHLLTTVLLLTLSNLLFLPAIVLAIYRGLWVEALSYTYTMFFSTFYHACDGGGKYTLCIMPYNVLSHCDFYGAIMSVWVTIVCLARLTERKNSFMYMLAALGLAMGVTWNQYSLWTFVAPALVALVVMIISWSQRCYKRHACYPSVKRWLLFLIPGLGIAGVGLIVYAFFETEANYLYTHSTWHACMALCIVFFLPPTKPKDKEVADHSLQAQITEHQSLLIESSHKVLSDVNIIQSFM